MRLRLPKLIALALFCVAELTSCTRSTNRDSSGDDPVAAIAKCLTQYKAGLEAGDLALSSPCSPRPRDEWERAMSAQVHANQEYLDALVAASYTAVDPAEIPKLRAQMNPMTGITRYAFSDIKVEGSHATAQVVMTVGGEERRSTQKLFLADGKWFVGSEPLSDADAREYRETAEVTNQYAKSVRELSDRVKNRRVSKDDAQQGYMALNEDLQNRIAAIRAKHPTKKP